MLMILPTWPVQDAKARFSELLDTCIAQGPQMVTKRGAEAAVLVPERGLDQHRPAVAWE
jgi:prevent-host-death family protein